MRNSIAAMKVRIELVATNLMVGHCMVGDDVLFCDFNLQCLPGR